MKLVLLFSLTLCMLSCSDVEALLDEDQVGFPPPIDLSDFTGEASDLNSRLHKEFIKNGFVVSLKEKKPFRLGDSLLWTGLALSVTKCSEMDRILKGLNDSTTKREGEFVRFYPLPSEYKNDPTSRDMEIGIIFGLVSAYRKCPRHRSLISSMWEKHLTFLNRNSGNLSPYGIDSKTFVTPSLDNLQRSTSQFFAGEYVESNVVSDFLNKSNAVISNYGKQLEGGSCYPYHLRTLMLMSLTLMEAQSLSVEKNSLCDATTQMGLPLTNWFCERGGSLSYLRNFKRNEYEYRHQRCSAEGPDNDADNVRTPALDFLIMYQFAGHNRVSDYGL